MNKFIFILSCFFWSVPTLATEISNNEPFIVTKTYNIYIDENCPEGEVSCDKVTYHAVNRDNHKEITLKGRVVNKKPSMDFAGYEFDNGNYAYTLTPDYSSSDDKYEHWVLNVYDGDKLIFSEEGKAKIK